MVKEASDMRMMRVGRSARDLTRHYKKQCFEPIETLEKKVLDLQYTYKNTHLLGLGSTLNLMINSWGYLYANLCLNASVYHKPNAPEIHSSKDLLI